MNAQHNENPSFHAKISIVKFVSIHQLPWCFPFGSATNTVGWRNISADMGQELSMTKPALGQVPLPTPALHFGQNDIPTLEQRV